jgi:hypothetical protein
MKKVGFLFAFLTAASLFAQSRGLEVVAKTLGGDYATIGKQYLVVIAVDRYRDWLPLKNPVKDAKEIRDILVSRYYIDQVFELYDEDATKANVLRLFDSINKALKPEDSVLIYYAGHGYLDDTDTGFWIPVDAGTDTFEQRNWIPNIQIRNTIGKMKSRHVALLSDSCFSGDILNATRGVAPVIDQVYYKNAFARVARQVLTSGASESVPDVSEFSQQLKLALRGNTQPYLDPLGLYGQIRLGMKASSPLYGDLKDSGHQDGASFLLFLRAPGNAGTAQSATPASLVAPAAATADLSIATSIEGAEVFIDGVSYGKAPALASSLPAGRALKVTARSGQYSGGVEVTLQPRELKEVTLKLERMKGNLIIASSEKNVDVIVDGEPKGPLGGGVFRDIPAGEVSLELRGPGLYYRAKAILKGDETTKVSAEPWAVGSIRYSAPEGASISFSLGNAWGCTVRGEGEIANVPVGICSLVADDVGYGKISDTLVVSKGNVAVFTLPVAGKIRFQDAPSNLASISIGVHEIAASGLGEIIFSAEPRVALMAAYRSKDDRIILPSDWLFVNPGEILDVRIPSGAIGFEWLPPGSSVSLDGAPMRLEPKLGALATTDSLLPGDYTVAVSIPSLGTFKGSIRVEANEIASLSALTGFQLDSLRAKQKGRRLKDGAAWVSLGVGILGAGGAGACYMLGTQAMADYKSAVASSDVAAARSKAELYSALFGVSAGLGGAGLGLSPLLFLSRPRKNEIQASIDSLDAQIKALSK